MTKLVILSAHEQRQFDSPPTFVAENRSLYFSLNNDTVKFIKTLRTTTNQVGFVLQLGYFRANGKFFTPQQFRKQDIDSVCKILKLDSNDIDVLTYQDKAIRIHRKKISELLHWQLLNQVQQEKIKTHIRWLIPQQLSPKQIFLSLIDFCWHNKIEVPSYNLLSTVISDIYNSFEEDLVKIVEQKLTDNHRQKLNHLLGISDEVSKQQMIRTPITLIKNINQSLRPFDIKDNIESLKIFKEYFYIFQSIIEELNLSGKMTEYFAIWVQKSTTFQLNQFSNQNKVYLHLLCYIKHQFYYRQDILVDIFLKSVQTAVNGSHLKTDQYEKQNRSERNKAIKQLSSTHKSSRALLAKITEIVKSTLLSTLEKLSQIEVLVDAYNSFNSTDKQIKLTQLEQSLEKIAKNQWPFDGLELISFKLQRRVSNIVKNIEFNATTSSTNLISAINYFRSHDGDLGNGAPRGFLSSEENEKCFSGGKLRVSLYKVLLFIHIADAIKSGNLNLLYSYRYQSIQEYLIDDETWAAEREALLTAAGLGCFSDFSALIQILKHQLDQKYKTVNERFLSHQNNFLTIDENNHFKITTPKTESSEEKYTSTLLAHAGFVPILKILSDVDHVTQFTSSFKHHSIKHTKVKPQPTMIFAGIIGKGCNIGVNRLANISIGVNEETLKNTVNWHFSLKNIQSANNKIMKMIDTISLNRLSPRRNTASYKQ